MNPTIAEQRHDPQYRLDHYLIDAARFGDLERVSALIKEGADVNGAEGRALLLAAQSGETDVVSLLLDRGADVHAQDDRALRCAAEKAIPRRRRCCWLNPPTPFLGCALRWTGFGRTDGRTPSLRA